LRPTLAFTYALDGDRYKPSLEFIVA
jgi:hypothetical protein